MWKNGLKWRKIRENGENIGNRKNRSKIPRKPVQAAKEKVNNQTGPETKSGSDRQVHAKPVQRFK